MNNNILADAELNLLGKKKCHQLRVQEQLLQVMRYYKSD